MNLFLHAEVNVKDASFFKSWSDGEIKRTYQSRSTHKGLLGTGWCLEVEKKLRITEKEIVLQDCSNEKDTWYLKNKNYFANVNSPEDKIIKSGQSYWRFLKDKGFQKFDEQGLLKVFKDNTGKYFEISYEKGLIKEITVNNKYKLTMMMDPKLGKVARIRGPRMAELLYLISAEHLTEVRQGKKTVLKYTYDEYDNMTSLKASASGEETMKYDVTKDWLLEYSSQNGCTEKYSYTLSSPLHFLTTLDKYCKGQLVTHLVYHFEYDKSKTGTVTLSKFYIESKTRLAQKPEETL